MKRDIHVCQYACISLFNQSDYTAELRYGGWN